jgi:hypothetical protein
VGNGTSAGAGTAGSACSPALQVSRRVAVKAVAVSTVAPPCVISITQCWVERLVRAGRAVTANGPSASAAQKLTVSDTGSPRRCGCCSTAFNACAAVTPPNGPTILA